MYDVPDIPDFLCRTDFAPRLKADDVKREIRMPKFRPKKKSARQKRAEREAAIDRRHAAVALLGYSRKDAEALTEKQVDEIVRKGRYNHTDKG